MKYWKINSPDRQVVSRLAADSGLPMFVCRILVSRGITARDEADRFFNSTEIADPFDIKDMDKAVNAINEAIDSGTKIAVYGDYDCDGITSTYILYTYLEAIGAEVMWYIPTGDEGYGLNNAATDFLKKQGVGLIITVDNGISAVNEAEYIRKLGMKLVITDHHEVPEVMPYAEAVVDPHRPDDISTFKYFAGCGVALKLVMAMEGDTDSAMTQFADIAAIGTVADCVNIGGENRIIVREGLRTLENTENLGLSKLLALCGLEAGSEIRASDIGFRIGPCINAARRCATPHLAMELLLSENPSVAEAKARELYELNDRRKDIVAEIMEQVEGMIRNDPDLLNKRLVTIVGNDWNHKIVGLVSGNIRTKYGKPSIVMAVNGDTARGSARSTEALPMPKLLTACADKLVYFGGHTKAAGFTVMTDMIPAFIDAVDAYCDENVKGLCFEALTADMELPASEITVDNVLLLNNLEPFGEGNESPQFLLGGCVIKSKKPLKDGKFVSYELEYGGERFRALDFKHSFDAFPYTEGDRVDIICSLEPNEYRGETTVKINTVDLRYSGIDQDRYFAALTAYEDLRRGKVDKRLLCRMIPDMNEIRQSYDILRTTESLSLAEQKAVRAGINLCKFRTILDIFGELGLAETDVTADSVKLIPTDKKVDITASRILTELKAKAG